MIKQITCPICDKALETRDSVDSAHFPFCSKRCQQIDFFRWCDGKYAIVEPVANPEDISIELLDEVD